MEYPLESLSSLLARCPELLFAAGPDGALLCASRGLSQALGAEALAAVQLATRVHPDDLGAWSSAWARIAEGA
jgi:rsbT co-antagonist protein RsbR